MKFLINFLLKPMSFIPAILVMLTIYSFSAQTSMESSKISSGLTVKIVKTADKILDIRMTTEQTNRVVERIHHFVRKLAHFSEYFLLAVCVALPLYVYGIRGIWLILLSVGSVCSGMVATQAHNSMLSAMISSKTRFITQSSFLNPLPAP